MLFTASANPRWVHWSWPREAVTGHQYRASCHGREREREREREGERLSNPMNGQLFMRTEQKKKAGGEDALPRWTSVILTSLLLHCDVLHEETATGASNRSLFPPHASQHATKSQSDYPNVLLRCTLFMPALSKDLASHAKKKKRKEKESNVLPTPCPGRVSF